MTVTNLLLGIIGVVEPSSFFTHRKLDVSPEHR